MYTNIVFDIDGTIINSDCAWNNAIHQVMKEILNFEMSEVDMKAIRGLPDELVFEYLKITNERKCAQIISRQKELYLQECYRNIYFDGIIELLDRLKTHGLTLGVVTNRIAFELDEPLWLNICSRFNLVITGDMVRYKKPNPEPMSLYLDTANIDRSKVLYVGDTRLDAECSEKARVDFALAMWGTHQPDLRVKYKPMHPQELLKMCIGC